MKRNIIDSNSIHCNNFDSDLKSTAEVIKCIISSVQCQKQDRKYIYRGESKTFHYPVSSGLYREYGDIIKDTNESLNILNMIQDEIILSIKRHFPKNTPKIEMLAEFQHFGGKTNLVDFSESLLIALFFACNKDFDKDGLLYLVPKNKLLQIEDIDSMDISPDKILLLRTDSKNLRPIFQNSVFVHFCETAYMDGTINCFEIGRRYKVDILDYLDAKFNISEGTVYNDIHGHINYQNLWKNALRCYYLGNIYKEKGDKLRKHGKKDDASDEYSDAIKQYSKVIKKHNYKKASLYNSLGYSHFQKNEYNEAIDNFGIAIWRDPQLTDAYFNRGYTYFKKNEQNMDGIDSDEYEKAINDFSEALNRNSENTIAYFYRGYIYYKKKNYEDAFIDFNKVIIQKLINMDDLSIYFKKFLNYLRYNKNQEKLKYKCSTFIHYYTKII